MRQSLHIAGSVFVGGVVGTSLRFAVGEAMIGIGTSGIAPILTVNLVGALALGWFAERARHAAPWSTPVVAFIGVGILGSFTTFSALSVETAELFRAGAWVAGTVYVGVSLIGGLTSASLGRRLGMPR